MLEVYITFPSLDVLHQTLSDLELALQGFVGKLTTLPPFVEVYLPSALRPFDMTSSQPEWEPQSASSASPQVATDAITEIQSRPSSISYLAVAVQSLEGGCHFHRVPVQRTGNGEQMWTSIQRHVFDTPMGDRLSLRVSICFARVVVGTGAIQEPQTLTSMPSNERLPISYCNYRPDWRLTDAFHNPTILAHHASYAADNERFTVNPALPTTELNGQDVIVIRKFLNKTKIAWLLVVLLMVSPSLGLAVGVYTHKPEIGVAVSAGVFALASFLQGLAAWFDG